MLGDAYEYLIAQFASGAGKKAGEFYTPQQVSKILAKIVTLDKTRIKSAYDPTCGSGSLLLRIAREADVGEFFGQELNRTTYNLARMNMILHDVHFSKFDIKQEDTLEHPQHLDERFDVVVANPPFSAKWKGKENPLNETDDRFSQYGALAPTSKADFAFVQHMIYQLNDSGTMAVVLPHGVLFRGAAEGKIREYIIKCIFRDIRPPIPTTSAHLYRGIRPALTRCREALVFDISFLAFRHVVEGLSFGRIVRRVRAGRRCAPAGRGWHLRRWVHQ